MIGVQDSAELRRIHALPRRVWTPEATADLVARMSDAHRAPGGTQTLRPLQAIALAEMGLHGGLYTGLPIGHGKTLLSLLAPRMFRHVKRPLLLVPAHLVEKTERESREYREHWVLPTFLKTVSYQTLSRVAAAGLLERYAPDLIVCDEAHYAKNKSAGVTKRIMRYLEAHPDCIVVWMTGTPYGNSLADFEHQSWRALGAKSPVPHSYLDLDEWSRALDVDTPDQKRMGFGALERFDVDDPVRGVMRRLYESPGFVLSQDPPLPIPIRITSHLAPVDPAIRDAFAVLRETGDTPDGMPCADQMEVWRHAREIATGFYSVWVPRAPADWRDARSIWASLCRDILSSNRRDLDTEEQLCQHLDALPEHYPAAAAALATWRAVKPTFKPNPVPHWISSVCLDWIVAWSRQAPGLIWTDRPAVGLALAARGLAYYGLGGVDQVTGLRAEEHDPGVSCVLARKVNDSGKNLQAWRRNLLIDIPSSGQDLEQLLGRTHRPGQRAERIDADLLFGCIEDCEAFWRAYSRSSRAQEVTGQAQKLCQADLSGVTEPGMLPKQPRFAKKTLTRVPDETY